MKAPSKQKRRPCADFNKNEKCTIARVTATLCRRPRRHHNLRSRNWSGHCVKSRRRRRYGYSGGTTVTAGATVAFALRSPCNSGCDKVLGSPRDCVSGTPSRNAAAAAGAADGSAGGAPGCVSGCAVGVGDLGG